VWTEPSAVRENAPVVVLLNSGIIHRPGPNRLYVRIARNLAARGYRVLRFDFSGVGDSDVRRDASPFVERAVKEAREAMDWVEREHSVERFVLMGLCSGALVAYRTALVDPRVVGAGLINGGAYFEGTDTEAVHEATFARHYKRMTFSSSFRAKNWKKALSGNVDYRGILRNAVRAPVRLLFRLKPGSAAEFNDGSAEFQALHQRGAKLFMIHSEGDDGLDYVEVVLGDKKRQWIDRGVLRFEVVPACNHTFTLLWSQQRLLDALEGWVEETWG
jgi:pimeloyl-ACP methyl ester carboxylesterase